MKKLYLLAIFLAVLLFAVSAVSAAIQIESVTSPTGNPGGPVTVQFTVKNTGVAAIPNVVVTSDPLIGPGGSITAPTISNVLNLGASATATRNVIVNLPIMQSGSYTSTLNARQSDDASNADSKPYSVTIASTTGLDITDRDTADSTLIVTADQGDRVTGTFKVKNTGSEPVSDVVLSFTQADFEDSDNDKITISTSPSMSTTTPLSLNPGQEVTVTMTMNVANAVDMNTYSGTITVGSSSTGKSDAFTLELRIQPQVCSDGKKGNLNMDLTDPDSGDDFKPGQKIPITVDVDNNENEDLDITVTAFLFDVDNGDNVEEVDSDTININEDDSDTFDFDLVVPDDVDASHTFKLFVKAYEDGNEDEQCDETSIGLDIKREKNDVIIKSIKITPATAKPTDTVSFEVTVQNIGSKDQDDVTLSLVNAELGLDLESNSFSLEKFDNDDTQIERVTFKIPDDAKGGTYDIEAIVNFASTTTSTFAPMRVEAPPAPPEAFASLAVSGVPDTADAGKAFDITVKVTNTGDAQGTFGVEVSSIAWADSVQSQTITLGSGKTGTLFFTIQTKSSATGAQTASVSVLSGNEVLDSQNINVNLKAATTVPPTTGFAIGSLFSGTTLWIIADILLVVIAIVFISMLFRSRKREQ